MAFLNEFFLESYVQGGKRKRVYRAYLILEHQPYSRPDHKSSGRIPHSFRTVMWVLERPRINHDGEDAEEGT